MKIAFVSSEAFPYAKTGGLADVAGALPKELAKLGCEVKLFIPKYYIIEDDKFNIKLNRQIGKINVRVNGHIRSVYIHQSKHAESNVEVNYIDCPHYFHRDSLYTDGCDEDERFILFNKAVIETLQRMQWKPDIIHCNDWQTGLLPIYLKDNFSWDKMFDETGTVFTIHNIGYQGRFNKKTADHAEINPAYFFPAGPTEYFGDISFLKTGINFSDIINTVSKTYAKEILTPQYGEGLENVLKQRKDDLYGILNGIDYSNWNPSTDSFLPHHFTSKDLSGKLENKKYLLEQLKIPFKRRYSINCHGV